MFPPRIGHGVASGPDLAGSPPPLPIAGGWRRQQRGRAGVGHTEFHPGWGGIPRAPTGRGGVLGCSRVAELALRPLGRPRRRARGLVRRGGPLGAGALELEVRTGQPTPTLGGGDAGGDAGVPPVGGATFQGSLRGGLRRSGRRKLPPAAQMGGRRDYHRTPPLHNCLASPGTWSGSPHARRSLPPSPAAERVEVRCGWIGVAAHAAALS